MIKPKRFIVIILMSLIHVVMGCALFYFIISTEVRDTYIERLAILIVGMASFTGLFIYFYSFIVDDDKHVCLCIRDSLL